MNKSEISHILESLKIQPEDISDKNESEAFRLLLQIIEILTEENQALKAELQKTRDELVNGGVKIPIYSGLEFPTPT